MNQITVLLTSNHLCFALLTPENRYISQTQETDTPVATQQMATVCFDSHNSRHAVSCVTSLTMRISACRFNWFK